MVVFQITDPVGNKRQVEVYTRAPENALVAVNRLTEEQVDEFPLAGFDRWARTASAGRAASGDDLSEFYTTLFRCMEIGATPEKSLCQAMYTARTPYMRGLLCAIHARLKAGSSLASAMSDYPESFDEATLALVKAGEEHGRLQEFLGDLARVTGNSVRLVRKCKGGMMYPMLLLGMSGCVVLIMCFFMVPKMVGNYIAMGVELPLFTRMLANFASFIRNPFFLVGFPVAIFMAWGSIKKSLKSDWAKRKIVRTPVLGALVRNLILVRTLRTLAILLRSGVRQIDAYKTVVQLSGYPDYSEYFDAIRERVAAGEDEATAFMRECRRIPKDGLKLAAYMRLADFVGETSGILNRIADLLEEDTDTMATELPKVVEPILLAVVGVVVGGCMAAVYLPGIMLMVGAAKKQQAGGGPAP
jgi:type IV pilus assembly protein PilC